MFENRIKFGETLLTDARGRLLIGDKDNELLENFGLFESEVIKFYKTCFFVIGANFW